MVRLFVYSLLGVPIGLIGGLAVSPSLAGMIFGAVIGAFFGAGLATYMNAYGILDRPFWNRQDIETVISHEQWQDRILPGGARERIYSWLRSKGED
jgi:uncharacterized membrane protein